MVGHELVVNGPSHSSRFVAVFEDDGETGYFYALDRALDPEPVIDALHIYNVVDVSDRNVPSHFQLVWSGDGLKVALFINRYPHAAFDFIKKRGYCRTGFPPPHASFSSEGHDWDDSVLSFFK
ncbi:MAG: DUF2251 domain-containing protein [Flavobacteriales bacterium]|nr:DUF2251 domain-containing protein [Flavobacteriales bacterium]